MEMRFQCQKHTGARLVPVGQTRDGGLRLLCARCSSLVVAGRGKVSAIKPSSGLGSIVPEGNGEPLVFLIDDVGTMLRVGQKVSFEYGVAGGDGSYRRAAMHVKPL